MGGFRPKYIVKFTYVVARQLRAYPILSLIAS